MSVSVPVAILMVSTFFVVGVIGAWAGSSRLHWFFRAAVVLTFLSPLLAAAALEPFVTLLLEAATIAGGAALWQALRAPPTNDVISDNRNIWARGLRAMANARFSLSAIFLAITLIAVLLTVCMSMPDLNGNALQSMALMGFGSGACVLLAGMAADRSRPWYLRWPVVVLTSLVLATLLAWLDWFVPSLVDFADWPPESNNTIGFLGIGIQERPVMLWFVILPSLVVMMAVWFTLVAFIGFRPLGRDMLGRGRSAGSVNARIAMGLLVFMVLTSCLAPAFGLWWVLKPWGVASIDQPPSKAHETVVKLGIAVAASDFGRLDDQRVLAGGD